MHAVKGIGKDHAKFSPVGMLNVWTVECDWICELLLQKKTKIQVVKFTDQHQYLGNCPPTPPLTQQQSIDNNLGLMLG